MFRNRGKTEEEIRTELERLEFIDDDDDGLPPVDIDQEEEDDEDDREETETTIYHDVQVQVEVCSNV